MNTVDMLLPLASVVLICLTRMIELAARRDTTAGPIRERLTLRLFVLAGTLMVAGSIVEFFVRHLTLKWWTFAGGWMCAAASVVIRRQAIAALGKFWSLHVEIRDSHRFVQAGPFRWMRHPTYFSMILELASIGLILNSPWTLLVVSLIFVPALLLRLRVEEAALVEKFGEAYRTYQGTTPALFPYRFPRVR